MYERNKDIYSRNGVKRVVIIGSGNVAEALAKAIGASRYELVQIYARNRERGQAIARAVRCACVGRLRSPRSAPRCERYRPALWLPKFYR